MSWELVGDRRRCARHDVTFGALETCQDCKADPGTKPDDAGEPPLPQPPAGCRSGEEHERRLTALAEYAEQLAHETADGTPAPNVAKAKRGRAAKAKRAQQPAYLVEPNPSLATKLLDVAIKAWRAAGEYTREREDAVRVSRLERLDRERRRSARSSSN